jgi:hypothetical protein
MFDVIMVICIGSNGAVIRQRLWTILQFEIFVMRMVVVQSFLRRIRSRMGTFFSRVSLFFFEITFARIITAVDSRIVIV